MAGEELRWSVRLSDAAPQKRWAIVATALVAAAAGWVLSHNLVLPVIGVISIFASTAEFWLPLKYVLDEKSARCRCGISVTAIEWSDVKRVLISSEFAKLSPLETDSRLSEFRGVKIRYGDRKREVLDWIESKVGESCSISGEKS